MRVNPFDPVRSKITRFETVIGPAVIESLPDKAIQDLGEVQDLQQFRLTGVVMDKSSADRLAGARISSLLVDLSNEDMVLGGNENRSCLLGSRSLFDYSVSQGMSAAAAVEAVLLQAEHLFSMFVVSPEVIARGKLPQQRWRVCPPTEFLTRLRLLQVRFDDLRLRGGIGVTHSLYQRYRLFRVFPEYQKAWMVGNPGTIGARPREVATQLESLGRRLEFICRALDEGLISALATPSNSSEQDLLYHIAVLVLLISGAYDDVAWLITHYYGFRLKSATSVSLNTDRGGRCAVADSVAPHNPGLATFLSSPLARDCIECLKPIRDRLQHRDFLQAVHLSGPAIQPSILVAVPKTALLRLAACTASPQKSRPGHVQGDELVDPYWLVESLTGAAARVVNECCRLFEWEAALADVIRQQSPTSAALTRPGQKQPVFESLRVFERSPGEFLNWGVDPVLFR